MTGDDNWLHGVKKAYRGLQEVTGGYKGLQGVTRGYRGLERSQILFLGLFWIKIKVEEI